MSVNILVISLDDNSNKAINLVRQSKLSGLKFVSISSNVQLYTEYLSDNHIVIDADIPGVPKLSTLLDAVDVIFIVQNVEYEQTLNSAISIANLAQELGVLCLSLLFKPQFIKQKKAKLEYLIKRLEIESDAQFLIEGPDLFYKMDNVLYSDSDTQASIIQKHIMLLHDLSDGTGLITLDFEDLKSQLKNSGRHVLLTGSGNTVEDVVFNTLNTSHEKSIISAQRLTVFIKSPEEASLAEIIDIVGEIENATLLDEPEIIFGVDQSQNNTFEIAVYAGKYKNRINIVDLAALAGILDEEKHNYDIPALLRYKSIN